MRRRSRAKLNQIWLAIHFRPALSGGPTVSAALETISPGIPADHRLRSAGRSCREYSRFVSGARCIPGAFSPLVGLRVRHALWEIRENFFENFFENSLRVLRIFRNISTSLRENVLSSRERRKKKKIVNS